MACGDDGTGRPEATPDARATGGRVHPRMRTHVFWAVFGVSIAVLAVVSLGAAFAMQRSSLAVTERDLAQECALVAQMLDASDDPVATARGLEMGQTRMTLVAADGTVLFDTLEEADTLGNHAARPEVEQALSSGEGFAMRESATLLAIALYDARLLDGGDVVRLAVTRNSVLGVLVDMLPVGLAVLGAVIVASALVARYLARRLVAPLDAVDPMHPLDTRTESTAYAEVIPLLRRIEDQHAQIEKQMLRLTDNDRMRVEFTANVTHELKTPLTVISGYAELIETGIAAPQDVAGFGGRIHEEALRLTALVNDILTLSRMDEAERVDEEYGVREPVDLRKVCDSVADRLEDRIRELGVALRVEGPSSVLATGIPKLADQIVYNLCDNALRYNKPDGSVTVSCGFDGQGRPYVTVADTGIGIAPENLEKVFNRFFRVDAGRSRETGGTGLGLAIVKHAARCQGAEVQIQSALGKGTAITVTFEKGPLGAMGYDA